MVNSKIDGTAPFFIIAGILAALDQLAKYLIVKTIPLNTRMAIIPGLLNLVDVRNKGGAFSIFARPGHPWRQYVFMGLTIVVVAAIAYAYGKIGKRDNWTRIAYICIAGGAMGNLVDRIRLREVIDFIDVYAGSWHWPAFNVADSAISTGAVMLLVSLIRSK